MFDGKDDSTDLINIGVIPEHQEVKVGDSVFSPYILSSFVNDKTFDEFFWVTKNDIDPLFHCLLFLNDLVSAR